VTVYNDGLCSHIYIWSVKRGHLVFRSRAQGVSLSLSLSLSLFLPASLKQTQDVLSNATVTVTVGCDVCSSVLSVTVVI
jgi:hypothetical protein